MHWAHPKLSKRQTVHLPCKQSPDIAAHVIANGRHLLCVPDKGTHLMVTWFDVHTHALANIRSNVSVYKHGRPSHADTQRDTKRISRSVSLSHLVCLDVHVSGRCTMLQAGGRKKKVVFPGKSRPANHISPCPTLWQIPSFKLHRPVHMVTCLLSLCQSQPTELKHGSDESVDANPTSQRNSPPS